MTPPPAAASPVDQSGALALGRPAGDFVASGIARLIDARNWSQVCLLVDVVLYPASSAPLFAAPALGDPASRWLAAAFPLLTLVILRARRSPDDRLHGSLLDTAAYVLGVVSLAAVLTMAAGSMLGGPHQVSIALRLWLFAAVYLGLARMVLLSVRRHAIRIAALATPTLIVGAGVVGEHIFKRLKAEPSYGLRPVGYLDEDPLPSAGPDGGERLPVLGGVDDLAQAVQQTNARRVILAFSSVPDHVLVEKVKECARLGVEVSLVPRLYEQVNDRARLDHVGGMPLLTLSPTDPRGWQFTVKHAFDRVFAGLALVAFAPLMLGCMLAVRLSSPGPIFFRQRRVGRDGCEFMMLKFRTMRGDPSETGEADAGWAAQIRGEDRRPAAPGISRLTGAGRILRALSLDELPQLFNVLR